MGLWKKTAEQITKFRNRFGLFNVESKPYLFLNNALPALINCYVSAYQH